LLPSTSHGIDIAARTLAVGGFAAAALTGAAFVPGLSSRVVVVATALAAFGMLGWTHMLDSDDRSYIRSIAVRASARFRVA
jgi:hypothetical protein